VVDKFEKEVKRFFAPIIAYQGWEDIVTEDMKNRIQMERLANPSSETATDYEAMIYLHTASLATPLSREMQNIYSFLFSKYHLEQAKQIGVYTDKITEQEQRELLKLKKWICQKQTESK
jgi:hypothetical protein